MKKSRTKSDDQSVSLGTISGVNLRLTTQNTLFVTRKKITAWPYLMGRCVHSDVEGFIQSLPKKAQEKIQAILAKKEEIRKQNPLDFDEDEAVYRFNYRY